MASIDTNVLIRFLTNDDQGQYEKARALFEREAIFISNTVILETEWVLRYAYAFNPVRVCTAFKKVFGLPNITLQNPSQLAQTLDWHQEGFDFADAFHVSLSEGHPPFFTFDRKLVRRSTESSSATVKDLGARQRE